MTFEQFYGQVEKIGCALVSMGFEKGDTACIIGDNAVEWVVADLGIQCVGGVSVQAFMPPMPGSRWPMSCPTRMRNFLFVENEEQLDKWLNFRDQTPGLRHVIVWDTRGLTRFSDPMVITFDDLLEKGAAARQADPALFTDGRSGGT
jgi:long-chain acyl-CoA synthetase